MPKILSNPYRNNLSIQGLTLRHDELLDQPVLKTSDVQFHSLQVGDLRANGTIFFTGNITEVETTHLVIKDNIIDINKDNEVPLLKGGFSIYRGPGLTPFDILYDENSRFLRIGFGSDLQAVATRQDNPDNGFPVVWNAAEHRFDTTGVITVPLKYANDVTAQKKVIFQPVGLTDEDAVHVSASPIGDLLVNTRKDIVLGSSDAPIGKSVWIPFGRRVSFGNSHLYADPYGSLIVDSANMQLVPSGKLSWGSLAVLHTENQGADLSISGSIISLKPTTQVVISNASPIVHGGVGRLQPVANGAYSLSSSGDLYITPGETADIVIPTLSFNKQTRFVGDINGNLNIDSVGDVFLSPKKNIIVNTNKRLCFGDGDTFATVDVTTGNFILQSPASIVLNGSTSVHIPARVPLHIANGTVLSESPEGASSLASLGDITFVPGVSRSINIPIDVPLRFATSESIVSHDDILTVNAGFQIVLSAPLGVNIPQGIPLFFGDNDHRMFQDNGKNLYLDSSHQIILKAAERVILDTRVLALGSTLIYQDVDQALTLYSGESISYVKTIGSFLVESLDAAYDTGAAALMTNGGVYVGKNLIVKNETTLLSALNIANTVTIDNTSVPIQITNRSEVDGTGIGFTSKWDFTGGYTIGRGTPDIAGGRSMMFSLPPYATYGMGMGPNFFFGSANGDPYMILDDLGLNLLSGVMFISSEEANALTVRGGAVISSVNITGNLVAGGNSLMVSPSEVMVPTQLHVFNAMYGFYDNGNQLLFEIDTTGNKFYLETTFKKAVSVGGDLVVKGAIRTDGALTIGGNLDLQGAKILNLRDPESDHEPATKIYVDSFLRGMSAKEAVMAASMENVDLAVPVYNLDDVPLSTGDRILLKDQTDPVENGIYELDESNFATRANDVYPGTDVSGSSVFVSSGTTYGSIGFVVVGNPVIVDTDPMTWTPFTGASQIVAGEGLTKMGNYFSVNVDGTTIQVNGDNNLEISGTFISPIGLEGGSFGIPVSTATDQSHVTMLGTITTGEWNASIIPVAYGGTGVASVRSGYFMIGNGGNPFTTTDKIYLDPVSGNFGIQTVNPRSNLHVVNVSGTTTGTWLRLEDTSPVMTQSSGVTINTVSNNAKIALRADGSLYIGQEDFTNASSLTLATQRISRLGIDYAGNVVIGNNPVIAGNVLSIYGKFTSTGGANIRGDLVLPTLTITSDSLGNTVLNSPMVKIGSGFDVGSNATMGNVKFVSTVTGETSIISMDRNTSLGLPMYLKTSATNASAVCISGGLLIPGKLQIGGVVGDAASGFSVFTLNNNLHFTPGIPGSGVLFNAPMSFGSGLSLYDRAKTNDFVTLNVSTTSFYIQTKTSTVSAPYNMIVGGGTNEIITTFTNKANSATVTYDPTNNAEYTGGTFTVSNSILTTFGSEVRLMDILRFNLGNSTEGVVGNTGWYYLGRLGIGRTTLTASLSWRIRIDYDGVSAYNLSILNYDRNVVSLVVYRGETGTYHLFLRVLSGPCRVSIMESPVRLYLSRYEGGGATPNGQYSGYTAAWVLDVNSAQAQSNAQLDFGSINVLGASTLNNTVLNGQTSVHGSLQVNGDSNFVGNNVVFSDPVTSLPKITMQTDLDGVSNVLLVHGADDTSPAVIFDRGLAQGSVCMIPSTSSMFADAMLVSHNSNTPSSQILFSTRGNPALLIDNLGATVVLSALDSMETGSVALTVKGGLTVDKRSLFRNSVYLSELCVMNAVSGAFIPIICDNDMTINVGESRISGLADPVNQSDAVNMRYVQGLVQGLSSKESVNAASANANVNISTVIGTLDDVVLFPGDRILLKNQTNPVENGVWVIQSGAPPKRASDLDVGDHAAATYVFVSQGTANSNSGWICSTTPGQDVVGVNALTFTQFSGAGQFNAGAGLAKIGNTIQILVDGVSLEIANNNLRVKSSIAGEGLTGGSGSPLSVSSITHLDTIGTIKNGTWNGGIIGVAYGGTGTANFAAGRIPFSNGVNLTQGSLYFDETNVRVGINTIAPTSGLTLQDRDFQLHQTVANVPYGILSSSVTNYTYAVRNDASKLIISSGTGVNKLALNDVVSLDNAGVLSVVNSVKSNSVVLGNSTRISSRTIESVSSGAFSMNMFSLDNSGAYLNIFGGLGTSNNYESSEFLRLGYYNGGYVLQTSATGVGAVRNLCLQAGGNTNQFVLQPNGNAIFNSHVYVNSTRDATSASDGGAFTVLGGGAFGGTLYAKTFTTTSRDDFSVSTPGGISGSKIIVSGTYQNYSVVSDAEGRLILSGNRTTTESTLHLVSYDADNGSNVLFKIFGLGKTVVSTSEWIQIGYEKNSATYGIRTQQGGAASLRPLVISATTNVNQMTMNTDGSVAFSNNVSAAGTFNISSIQDATSATSTNSALSVAGGASVSKSLYVGTVLSTPVEKVSDRTEYSASGSIDSIYVGYTSGGQFNVYNNGTSTVNIHTGNSLGPKSPNQEKLVVGYGSATTHVVRSLSSGTGITRDLVLSVGNYTDQLRLYNTDGSIKTTGDFYILSTSESTSFATGSLQVSGGFAVKKTSNFAGRVNIGSGVTGVLFSLNGASSWAMTSPESGRMYLQASGTDSVWSVADVAGTRLLSVDAVNKTCTSSCPLVVTGMSTRALTIQNTAAVDLFAFDTTNHLFNMAGGRIVNVGYPQLSSDCATKSYVDTLVKGLNLKAAAHAAPATNVDLTKPVTIVDGVTIGQGWRVLLMFQTNAVENGIYTVVGGNMLVRADDLPTGSRAAGAFCFVQMGAFRGDKGYVCIADYPNDIVGTNALGFTQFNGNIISAGLGLVKDGNNVMNVNLDPAGSGLSFNGNYLRIDPSFAGNGLQLNNGVLGLTPITAVDTIIAGTWQGANIAVAYGGTGNNFFPDKEIVFSNGNMLKSSGKFLWDDTKGALGINISPDPLDGGDAFTLKNGDVAIHGENAGMYIANSVGNYNWGFSRITPFANSPVRGFDPQPWTNVVMSKDGSKILIVSEPGYIDYISLNDGYNWEVFLNDGNPHVWGEIVMSYDGSIMLACASEEYLFVSNDGGVTFKRSLTDFGRIWEWTSISDNGQYMLASALADGLFASNDAGQTWKFIPEVPTDPVDLGFVHVVKDGSRQFAGYFGGPLFESTDYGATFTKRTDIRDGNYYDIAESRDSNVLVLFEDAGSLFVSTDTGATWSEKLTDTPRRWVSVFVSADGSSIAAADTEGSVWFSKDFGTTWATLYGGLVARWNFVVVADDNLGVIAGGNDVPLHITTDGGDTFVAGTDRNMVIPAGALSPVGLFYYAEYNGNMYRYLYTPSTNLVISAGSSSKKSDLTDFMIMTDRQQVGIGFDRTTAGMIGSTLDVNGTMYVSSIVQFGAPLEAASGGTGSSDLPYGLVIANGKEPFTSTYGLPNGAVPVGSTDGSGRIIIEQGSTLREHLGLGIGTHIQAWNKNLDDISSLSPILGYFIMGNGTDFVMGTAEAAANSMGLGRLAYLDYIENYHWSGDPLSIENGGTGGTTFAANVVPFYNGMSFSDSNMYYDYLSNAIVINGSTAPMGSGLAVNGSDISLQTSANGVINADITWNNADGKYVWSMKKKSEGGAGAAAFVLSGGLPSADKTALADRLSVASTGEVSVLTTTESTAVGIGALKVSGGASFAKNIYSAGKLVITNNTEAVAGSNGAIVVAGGISVAKTVTAANVIVSGTSSFSSVTDATSATVASVTYAGGIGVTGKIWNKGGVIVERSSTVGSRASGLTVAYDAVAWTSGAAVTDTNRHVSLISNVANAAVTLSMRNLLSTNGWDVVVEGAAPNRMIWQTSTGTAWMTLSSTTGDLVLNGTSATSVNTAGGITCAKGISCAEITATGTVAGAFYGALRNTSNSTSAYTILRLYNDSGTALSGNLFLNSTTRTAEGGASAMTLRNDFGLLRLQGASSTGLTIAGTGGATFDGTMTVSSTTEATSSTNGGSATVMGGLAVAKSTFIGGNLNVTGTITVSGAVTSPTVTSVPVDLINVTTISMKSTRLVVVNNQYSLCATFKVTPTVGSQKTVFTFNLPGRVTNFVESLDMDTGQCSGFTDTVNYIVLQNTLCTGVPGSTKAMVTFQSVNTDIHYLQVYVSYAAV